MLKDSDCCVFRALGRYDISSTETFLFVSFFGGGVPCWERVGMEFFQPVQRQNSFVDLKLAPATPSIKEVIHAVANYKNTAAQCLFSHPPPQTNPNATWRIGWQRRQKTKSKKPKKKKMKHEDGHKEKNMFSVNVSTSVLLEWQPMKRQEAHSDAQKQILRLTACFSDTNRGNVLPFE